MKILFVTDLYPIKQGERNCPLTLHRFVANWIQSGNKVDVIRPNFLPNSFLRGKVFYKNGFYEYENVRIFNVNYFSPFLFDITKKLSTEIDLKSYDIIVAHMPSGAIFANKLAKIAQKPIVCAVHCSDIEVLTKPMYKVYFKKKLEEAYKNSKKIACRSFVLQKKFCKLYPDLADKTFVAPSGISVVGVETPTCVDVGQVCPTYKPLTSHFSPFTILTCANLIKRKNVDKLILAVNDLAGFELTVIGQGKELSRLRKIASKNVKFVGKISNKEVLEQMKNSHIFILPSIRETFGMVYLEAMASGCITVCTKDDGIDGIIKDGENGFLCEPTIQKIKEILIKIKNLENKEKIIQNSINTAKSFCEQNCALNYLENIK